jgi:glycosyltransferase involved in cell wall biosynthesis
MAAAEPDESGALFSPRPGVLRTRAVSFASTLRIGIVTDGLEERETGGGVQIANGGVGVYIYQLIKHLPSINPGHRYVLIRCGNGRLDVYENERCEPVFLPLRAATVMGAAIDLPYRRLVDRLRLDLLHYPNQFGGAWLPRSAKRVVTLHDLTPLLFRSCHPWMRVTGYRLLLRRALRVADAVIVDATSTATDLIHRRLADAAKITVVPLGVSERFHPHAGNAEIAARYSLPPRFLLTVGVLEPRKNHARLAEALARLHHGGTRIGLVIAGREGWGWRDPLQDPSLRHLRPWVRVLRNVPENDLPGLYCQAEAFVYPSLYEGFGLPILEAMACGTPVLTSNVSSMPEVAGDAALLADPRDPADLAAKLHAVLADGAVRRRLIAAGRARAAEHTWRRTAEKTVAVYERVCRNGAGRLG